MRTVEELTRLFRASGRKVTPQRQCIFRVLQGDESHPTAEAVHQAARRQMSTISLRTVYQTLHDLAEMGELAVLEVGTGSVRFDPNVERPHHHLVCQGCGRTRDLYLDLPEARVPEAGLDGFEVSSAEVVLRGRCRDCRAAAPG
ncbi:MAG TPA: Fur family transcriptional regulator [Acidimicrobiales bacterium]|nr:Fur family transcriptional regulator [Acidimicrobiales bacterium]